MTDMYQFMLDNVVGSTMSLNSLRFWSILKTFASLAWPLHCRLKASLDSTASAMIAAYCSQVPWCSRSRLNVTARQLSTNVSHRLHYLHVTDLHQMHSNSIISIYMPVCFAFQHLSMCQPTWSHLGIVRASFTRPRKGHPTAQPLASRPHLRDDVPTAARQLGPQYFVPCDWFYLVLSGSRRLFSISFRGWVSGASWRQAKATMRLWRVAPNPAEFIRICMRICRICTLNFEMLWHNQEIRVNNVQQTHIQMININDMIDYFMFLF